MNSFNCIQERLRNRRDRLESPSPAHDLLIVSGEDEREDAWEERVFFAGPLGGAVVYAWRLAEELETHAVESGSLWARQQVDEALSFAIRLAERLCKDQQSNATLPKEEKVAC